MCSDDTNSDKNTDRHDITEMLLKVALNTIIPIPNNMKTVKINKMH